MTERQPHRVQRKRSSGWTMPPNTVYVGRPFKWGNPWKVRPASKAVELFERYEAPFMARVARQELRGKNLACWCRLDQPCHADILLKLANAPDGAGERASDSEERK